MWQSDAYTVLRDGVVQGPYRATAASATSLASNYQPDPHGANPRISFKFSLNGKDNEMMPGRNHAFVALQGPSAAADVPIQTPIIAFDQPEADAPPVPAGSVLAPSTPVIILLDLRPVLAAFQKAGFYTTLKGEKIYQADFKHVFVAGDTAPLS